MGWVWNCSAVAAALASAPAYAIALFALTIALPYWVSRSVLLFALPMAWVDIPARAAYPIAMISPAISTMVLMLSALSVDQPGRKEPPHQDKYAPIARANVPWEAVVIDVGCPVGALWSLDTGRSPDEAFLNAIDYSLEAVCKSPYEDTVSMNLKLRNTSAEPVVASGMGSPLWMVRVGWLEVRTGVGRRRVHGSGGRRVPGRGRREVVGRWNAAGWRPSST